MMTTRRNFIRLGAASAGLGLTGAAALSEAKELLRGGKDYSARTGAERKAVPSACWQCVSRCPIIGYNEDGRTVKIGPQPNSIRTEGFICAKSQGGVNQVTDPDRILYPMRRVGKRGEGKWKRITWDDALTELAERMKKLRDAGTPEKFMFHYGRMKASSAKIIKSVFLATYGTHTIGNHDSICEGGKWVAQELTWGGHYDNWDLDNTRYVLNVGSNCLEAHTNHVSIAQRLARALVDHRIKMVTLDVRLSNTAAKSTEWVPVKSGTDAAPILAMCHVIMKEGLYVGEGEDFLKFCKATKDPKASLEEKVAALKAHLEQYSPEWAEKISGVPAAKIREIAREFAFAKPAVAISYRGAVAHYNGVEAERALQMLSAITGNIDNPGGRCKAVGPKWKYPKGPKNKPHGRGLNILNGFPGQVAYPTHHVSNQVLSMIKDGSAGRPEIYMWYCHQPVYSNADCKLNAEVLSDESMIPFTVSVSPFYDESSALADMILPDATYLERWDYEDMVSPTQTPEYYIRQPIAPPLGECRDFSDVCIELAERMGFPLGFKSKEEFVKLSCEMTKPVKEAGGFEYMKQHGVWHNPKDKPRYFTYLKKVEAEALSADGVVFDIETGVYWNWKKAKLKNEQEALDKGYKNTKHAYKAYVGQQIGGDVYVGFKPDKVNKSGYFELYSELLEAKGFNPMPSWIPIPEHEQMKPNQMVLTTHKVNVQSHSRTQNCKWLTEIYHENPAWINPADAYKRGIVDGGSIKVKSAVGEIETRARVTPAVRPGVIAISFHCGHWQYGRYASGVKPITATDSDPDVNRIWWRWHGEHPNWVMRNSPDPIGGEQRWMDTVVDVSKV